MNESKTDRRILKTRAALSQALVSLMREKKYDEITVNEILEKANTGRSTFYLHFRDKDALLSHSLEGMREYLETALGDVALEGSGLYEAAFGFSAWMFDHADSHRALYRSLIGGEGWPVFSRRLEEMLNAVILSGTESRLRPRKESGVPPDLFLHFLRESFLSVLTWWLEQKRRVPPEKINGLFRELMEPTLAAHFQARGRARGR